MCLKREGPLTPTSVAMVTDITCEQLAILEMGSPTLGHHATSLTQSVWASSFSSVTQLSLSSLVCEEREERGGEGRGGGGEGRRGEGEERGGEGREGGGEGRGGRGEGRRGEGEERGGKGEERGGDGMGGMQVSTSVSGLFQP